MEVKDVVRMLMIVLLPTATMAQDWRVIPKEADQSKCPEGTIARRVVDYNRPPGCFPRFRPVCDDNIEGTLNDKCHYEISGCSGYEPVKTICEEP